MQLFQKNAAKSANDKGTQARERIERLKALRSSMQHSNMPARARDDIDAIVEARSPATRLTAKPAEVQQDPENWDALAADGTQSGADEPLEPEDLAAGDTEAAGDFFRHREQSEAQPAGDTAQHESFDADFEESSEVVETAEFSEQLEEEADEEAHFTFEDEIEWLDADSQDDYGLDPDEAIDTEPVGPLQLGQPAEDFVADDSDALHHESETDHSEEFSQAADFEDGTVAEREDDDQQFEASAEPIQADYDPPGLDVEDEAEAEVLYASDMDISGIEVEGTGEDDDQVELTSDHDFSGLPDSSEDGPGAIVAPDLSDAAEDLAALAVTGSAGAGRGRKTRLLGFDQTDGLSTDLFAKAEKSAANMMVKFPVGWMIVVDGPGCGEAFALTAGASQIGRGPGQAIRLDFGDTSISRENHAAIAYDKDENTFVLAQGGKTNLVRLNKRPVLSNETLSDKDEIRIGKTTLRFVALCGPDFSWSGIQAGGDDGKAST